MIRTLLVVSALGVLTACGGSSQSAASGTTANGAGPSQFPSTARCRISVDGEGEDRILTTEIDGRFGLIVPADVGDWNPSCIDDGTSALFWGEIVGETASFGVSLEEVGSFELHPFEESAYFAMFSRVMMAHRTERLTAAEDLGTSELQNGHLAWLVLYDVDSEAGPEKSLHGYSVRPLADDRVLIAHVSISGARLDMANARDFVSGMLSLFGTDEDFERLELSMPDASDD